MSSTEEKYNIRGTFDRLFKKAKRYWTAGLVLKFGVVIWGTLSIYVDEVYKTCFPIWLAVLALAAEALIYYSDKVKGQAEDILRRYDMFKGFGWDIDAKELSNICGDKVIEPPPPGTSDYFASDEAVGNKKAVENLEESSWYSWQIASAIAVLCTVIIFLLVFGSYFALAATIAVSTELIETKQTARVITGVLSLIWAVGLFRLAVGYYKFGNTSKTVTDECARMLKQSEIDKESGIKVWHNYQLNRASAPLLPGWYFWLFEKRLNDGWAKLRAAR